jgi:outer membrane protein assembly factor BamB
LQGICSSPLLEGDRVWLVTNRGEVVCLDAEGFYDDEDDGPVQGIRGDLFRVHTHLHSTLGEYWVNQKLKDALVKAGLKLPPSPFVQKAAAGSRWIICERIPGDSQPVQRLRIDLIRDELHIVPVEAGGADSPPAVVIRDALWDGLGTPAIVQSLRPEFAKAGLELRADIEVRTTEEGRAWAFDLITADGRIEVVVRHVQDRLIASHTSFRKSLGKQEADVVWSLDMMKELGVSQHNMCTCAPTAWGNVLFICTSNGVDEAHMRVAAPQAPSFIALDKHTGKILWTDNSPGENIQHGQWSPPAVGVFAGIPQVIFCGGDGWVYSFHAEVWRDGKPNLLWKFDTNPKDTVLELGGRGTRNEPIAVPVIYDGLVYVTTGQDPEHGEGAARMWCIDPTRRGDVSPQLVVLASDRKQIVPHRRMKAADPERGEVVIDNQNSAVVWQYAQLDTNGDGKLDFEEQFHRAIASVVIKDDILVTIDFSGLAHCLNAKSGGRYWACDMLAAGWGTPLIVGTHIYVPDEDGDIAILELDPRFDRSGILQPDERPPFIGSAVPQREINMLNSVYSTPIFANGVLYIANKDHLFAIVPNPSPDHRTLLLQLGTLPAPHLWQWAHPGRAQASGFARIRPR